MGIFLSFKNTNYKIPLQEDTKQGIQGFIFYPRARGRLAVLKYAIHNYMNKFSIHVSAMMKQDIIS